MAREANLATVYAAIKDGSIIEKIDSFSSEDLQPFLPLLIFASLSTYDGLSPEAFDTQVSCFSILFALLIRELVFFEMLLCSFGRKNKTILVHSSSVLLLKKCQKEGGVFLSSSNPHRLGG